MISRNPRYRQLRKCSWYREYNRIADELATQSEPAKALRLIHSVMNGHSGYGTEHTALAAGEAIELIILERGWNKPATPEKKLAYLFILGHFEDPVSGKLHLDDEVDMFCEDYEEEDAEGVKSADVYTEVLKAMEEMRKIIAAGAVLPAELKVD